MEMENHTSEIVNKVEELFPKVEEVTILKMEEVTPPKVGGSVTNIVEGGAPPKMEENIPIPVKIDDVSMNNNTLLTTIDDMDKFDDMRDLLRQLNVMINENLLYYSIDDCMVKIDSLMLKFDQQSNILDKYYEDIMVDIINSEDALSKISSKIGQMLSIIDNMNPPQEQN